MQAVFSDGDIFPSIDRVVSAHFRGPIDFPNRAGVGRIQEHSSSPARNFALSTGFELVDEQDREVGGLPTMPGGRKPVLPVTVFTDYI
jgi:hypothetical protein